jgi:mgtE-like transporter
MIQRFTDYPGLLLLLPAFLATRGNVYGALGARIASGLHQGLLTPRFTQDKRLINAVTASFINGIGISIVIAVLAWVVLTGLNEPTTPLPILIAILLIAGVFTSIILITGLLTLVFLGYRHGLDPDNLIGPIVTTLGDIFGVAFLLGAVIIVEGLFL